MPFKKGNKEYLKRFQLRGERHPMFGKKHSAETKFKISQKHQGKVVTEEFRRKMSLIVRKGKDSNFWKGGVTNNNKKVRNSLNYKLWRKAVFERDDYTCQFCDKRGGYLEADHIKPFAYFVNLRFELSNGRTLCLNCHRKTFKKVYKYRKEYVET
jgi:hypothetical protein